MQAGEQGQASKYSPSLEKRSPLEAWAVLATALKAEEQIKVMIELLLRRRLLAKAERVFKKPKPGKKRLAKWPKKLQPLNDVVRSPSHHHYLISRNVLGVKSIGAERLKAPFPTLLS